MLAKGGGIGGLAANKPQSHRAAVACHASNQVGFQRLHHACTCACVCVLRACVSVHALLLLHGRKLLERIPVYCTVYLLLTYSLMTDHRVREHASMCTNVRVCVAYLCAHVSSYAGFLHEGSARTSIDRFLNCEGWCVRGCVKRCDWCACVCRWAYMHLSTAAI